MLGSIFLSILLIKQNVQKKKKKKKFPFFILNRKIVNQKELFWKIL